MSIEDYHKKIEGLLNDLEDTAIEGGYKLSLANSEKFDISIGQHVLNKELFKMEVRLYTARMYLSHLDMLMNF